ncbi:ABC transporter permease [Schaalia cardiffensis]|uniref:ABC transporter permease n=1 Tax=Schaalia cardiffensis TaxID=181487 RepID=UPI0030B8EC2F
MNLLMDALVWLGEPTHWVGAASIPVRLLQHLGLTFGVVTLAALIALPLGIMIGHTGRFRFLIVATSGAARAIPTLGVLTLAGLWLGIGLAAPVLALLVLAIPPMLTATYTGIDSADPRAVDAARAIGLKEWQIIRFVELPAARTLILGGLRSTTLQVLATATLAAYTADAGLGRYLYIGLKTRDYGQMIAGAILVVALALVLDGLWVLVSRAASRRAGDGEVSPPVGGGEVSLAVGGGGTVSPPVGGGGTASSAAEARSEAAEPTLRPDTTHASVPGAGPSSLSPNADHEPAPTSGSVPTGVTHATSGKGATSGTKVTGTTCATVPTNVTARPA